MSVITVPDKRIEKFENTSDSEIFDPREVEIVVVSGYSINNEVKTDKKVILEVMVHSEDDIFWAEIPQLPGCYTQADTAEELEYNIIEAINLYLESFKVNDPKRPNYQIDNLVPSLKYI